MQNKYKVLALFVTVAVIAASVYLMDSISSDSDSAIMMNFDSLEEADAAFNEAKSQGKPISTRVDNDVTGESETNAQVTETHIRGANGSGFYAISRVEYADDND